MYVAFETLEMSTELTPSDNNFSYPSPTDLVANATYNMQCEDEYLDSKTGESSFDLYRVHAHL